jgi:tetratricopeptide (TPR) repeat protein
MHESLKIYLMNDREEQDIALEKYRNRYPTNKHALMSLFTIYDSRGEYKRAENLLVNIIEQFKDFGAAYVDLATFVYTHYKDLDLTLDLFNKAIELAPDDNNLYFNLGEIYRRSGNIEKAIECFKKAIELYEFDAAACNNLAVVFKSLGMNKEAYKYLMKAIKADPTDFKAYTNLAHLISEEYLKYEDAQRLLEFALEINPNHIDALLKLGALHLDYFENRALAKETFLKAHEIDPTDLEAKMALFYLADNNKEEYYFLKLIQKDRPGITKAELKKAYQPRV